MLLGKKSHLQKNYESTLEKVYIHLYCCITYLYMLEREREMEIEPKYQ